MRDLLNQCRLIGFQFTLKGLAALKGVVGQHPLAEAVDGVDGGLVKAENGTVELAYRLLWVLCGIQQCLNK